MKRFCACVLATALMVTMGQNGCPLPIVSPSFRPVPAVTIVNLTDTSLNVSFTVDLSNYPDASSINWDFGDGGKATGLSIATGHFVSHSFVRSGVFAVAVYLFNSKTLLATGGTSVTVLGPNHLPTASFTFTDQSDNAGGVVPRGRHFDAGSSSDPDGSISTFNWDFGDGSLPATGLTVDHAFANSGRFNVKLTVTDNRGGSASVTQSVAANLLPTADFSSTPNGPEAPPLLTVAFDGSASSDSDGSIVAFSWDFGDGTAAGTGQTPHHTYTIQGVYDVKLTVNDNLGGAATKTQSLDLRGTLPFIRSIAPRDGEVGSTVNITALLGGNFQNGAAVRLTRTGQSDVTGGGVTVTGTDTITCNIDLTGAQLGDWNVVVRNPGGAEATLTAGFRIVTENQVRLTTNMGDILLQLDKVHAPGHTANFLQYVDELRYDGIVFHRVVKDFVIQGGAFKSLGENANPRLAEQQPLPAINSEANNGNSNVRGTIALALRGQDANSGTSQFFINLVDNTNLDTGPPPFTVFGTVIQGMDVADQIAGVAVANAPVQTLTSGVQTFQNVPVHDVTILTARRE